MATIPFFVVVCECDMIKVMENIMILKGEYNSAKVFIDEIEESAKNQILELLNQAAFQNLKIRIMPDVHLGVGSVIGTTMEIKDKVVPNLVGVDIGCGLIVSKLKERVIDYHKLDETIKREIPSGFKIRERSHQNSKNINLENLRAYKSLDIKRGYLSIGTLGGGNHFIEVNQDEDFNKYLVIHSGSRHLGLQVANHYQKLARQYVLNNNITIPKDLAYLENKLMEDYLHDMKIIQEYASLNRETMAEIIVSKMGFKVVEKFQTVHNYIDLKTMILRKGAVSALKDEKFIIPFNMADGSVILKGKGNSDWNYSAPHGAGRVMSRTYARKNLKLADYQKEVAHLYSSSISLATIDEAPMAYKKPKDILKYLDETAEIINYLKPVYNFKAK